MSNIKLAGTIMGQQWGKKTLKFAAICNNLVMKSQ